MRRIVEQEHQPPDASEIQALQLSTRWRRDDCLSERLEQVKNSLPTKAKQAVELVTEKGWSNWLTVIPLNMKKTCTGSRKGANGFRDATEGQIANKWRLSRLSGRRNQSKRTCNFSHLKGMTHSSPREIFYTLTLNDSALQNYCKNFTRIVYWALKPCWTLEPKWTLNSCSRLL